MLLLQSLIFLLQTLKPVLEEPPAPASRDQVVPFLGIAVIHRLCALSTVSSVWLTTTIRRGLYVERLTVGTSEVHGRMQGSSSLLRKKIFLPLTAGTQHLHLGTQGSASSLCWKKCFLPLTYGTHQPHLHTQGRASLLRAKNSSR
jgi:hypothetical protein